MLFFEWCLYYYQSVLIYPVINKKLGQNLNIFYTYFNL